MTEYLFSYGTLQKEKVQRALFGRLLQGRGDVLRGYRIATIEIKDQAFLATGEQANQLTALPSTYANDSIKGTVLELTEEELLAADKYEPDVYKRIRVTLASGKEAWLYSAAAPSNLIPNSQ
jgi:gamma-glutamylcyclotransferase (GGCT)/AIG2-like uncharacterized protein YtfP